MCEARLSEDAVQPTTAAEVAPWSKTGGLADVMSALPAALVARGHRVMTVSPRYSNYHNAVDTGLEAPVAGVPLPNPQQQLAPSSPTHSQSAQAHPHLLQLEMPEAHASAPHAPGLPIHRPQASKSQGEAATLCSSHLMSTSPCLTSAHPSSEAPSVTPPTHTQPSLRRPPEPQPPEPAVIQPPPSPHLAPCPTPSSARFFSHHTPDGVQHVLVEHPLFHADPDQLVDPGATPSGAYLDPPGGLGLGAQARFNVLCQAALAAPVLLWNQPPPATQPSQCSPTDPLQRTAHRVQGSCVGGQLQGGPAKAVVHGLVRGGRPVGRPGVGVQGSSSTVGDGGQGVRHAALPPKPGLQSHTPAPSVAPYPAPALSIDQASAAHPHPGSPFSSHHICPPGGASQGAARSSTQCPPVTSRPPAAGCEAAGPASPPQWPGVRPVRTHRRRPGPPTLPISLHARLHVQPGSSPLVRPGSCTEGSQHQGQEQGQGLGREPGLEQGQVDDTRIQGAAVRVGGMLPQGQQQRHPGCLPTPAWQQRRLQRQQHQAAQASDPAHSSQPCPLSAQAQQPTHPPPGTSSHAALTTGPQRRRQPQSATQGDVVQPPAPCAISTAPAQQHLEYSASHRGHRQPEPGPSATLAQGQCLEKAAGGFPEGAPGGLPASLCNAASEGECLQLVSQQYQQVHPLQHTQPGQVQSPGTPQPPLLTNPGVVHFTQPTATTAHVPTASPSTGSVGSVGSGVMGLPGSATWPLVIPPQLPVPAGRLHGSEPASGAATAAAAGQGLGQSAGPLAGPGADPGAVAMAKAAAGAAEAGVAAAGAVAGAAAGATAGAHPVAQSVIQHLEHTASSASSGHSSSLGSIIFIANDWPTGLLPLWLLSYRELAASQPLDTPQHSQALPLPHPQEHPRPLPRFNEKGPPPATKQCTAWQPTLALLLKPCPTTHLSREPTTQARRYPRLMPHAVSDLLPARRQARVRAGRTPPGPGPGCVRSAQGQAAPASAPSPLPHCKWLGHRLTPSHLASIWRPRLTLAPRRSLPPPTAPPSPACTPVTSPLVAFQLHVARSLARARIAFVLHNVAHSGLFSAASFSGLGLPAARLQQLLTRVPASGSVDPKQAGSGQISWLQAGVLASDLVLTVSPHHARELQQLAAAAEVSSVGVAQPGNTTQTASLTSDQLGQLEQDQAASTLRTAAPASPQPHDPGGAPPSSQLPTTHPPSPPDPSAPHPDPSAPQPPPAAGQAMPGVSSLASLSPPPRLLHHLAVHGVVGIMNGVDTGIWCPAGDPLLPRALHYGPHTMKQGKATAKALLQSRLGLAPNPHLPLFAFVGRLVEQKGADLLLAALPLLLGPAAPGTVRDPRQGQAAGQASGQRPSQHQGQDAQPGQGQTKLRTDPSEAGLGASLQDQLSSSPYGSLPPAETRAATTRAAVPSFRPACMWPRPAPPPSSSPQPHSHSSLNQPLSHFANSPEEGPDPPPCAGVSQAIQGSPVPDQVQAAVATLGAAAATPPSTALHANPYESSAQEPPSPLLYPSFPTHPASPPLPLPTQPPSHPGLQLVMVGAGLESQEACLAQLQTGWAGAAVGLPGFNPPLVHLLLAAADFLVLPSRWEPCGLLALQALRYAALPLVSPVGGLMDAVGAGPACGQEQDWGQWQQQQQQDLAPDQQLVAHACGFSLPSAPGPSSSPSSTRHAVHSLAACMRRLAGLHGLPALDAMRVRCMQREVSWGPAATDWEDSLAALVGATGCCPKVAAQSE
ncbi:hypothetical protein QJQ45_012841 [Haematococcus lacustris]|nr:hypothetical protein QJQ45_012841 [Haematococcus lacustris]